MKCLACGAENMVEGSLMESNGGGDIFFKFADTPMLKSIFGIGMRPVRAHGCAHCGHLQLSVRFSNEDLERRQRFEGEQPSVLERLEGEDSRQ
jgi:hypothetical protein